MDNPGSREHCAVDCAGNLGASYLISNIHLFGQSSFAAPFEVAIDIGGTAQTITIPFGDPTATEFIFDISTTPLTTIPTDKIVLRDFKANWCVIVGLCIALDQVQISEVRINGVPAPASLDIGIDIIPGSSRNAFELDSEGRIPVALLSSTTFDAPTAVDRTSLKFGPTGDEISLVFCQNNVRDVNHDGLPDLVCVFSTKIAGFRPGDTVGVLKGKTVKGVPFSGKDMVSPRPEDRDSRPDSVDGCLLSDGTRCQAVWPF